MSQHPLIDAYQKAGLIQTDLNIRGAVLIMAAVLLLCTWMLTRSIHAAADTVAACTTEAAP